MSELKGGLALPATIAVLRVSSNPLLVSVEPSGRDATFVLSLESGFVDGLSDEELRAVVAHELGHVWIFTHHPFLHTERLANDIAMRVVSRETLARVYSKVWERTRAKGDLERFLGQ